MDNSSRNRTNLLQSALDALKHSTQFSKRVVVDDDDANFKSNLEELKNTALMYCQMDAEFKQFEKNFRRTDNFFKEIEHLKDVSVTDKFNEFFMDDTTPDNATLSKHPIMMEFYKNMEEVEFEKNNETHDEFIPPIDPVTKNPIRNPVKNPQCGHIYEKDSITELIEIRKNTRCPYIGCPALQYIKLDQLVVDTELKNKINRYNFDH